MEACNLWCIWFYHMTFALACLKELTKIAYAEFISVSPGRILHWLVVVNLV